MKTWTKSAEERLDAYLSDRVHKEQLSPGEAAEVIEDWRLHIHEEAERQPGDIVDQQSLEQILDRLGESTPSDPARPPAPRAATGPVPGPTRHVALWTFGVILPAGVILFETVARFCGSVFFNPVPTWMHFLLLASVPVGNGWLLRRLSAERASRLMPLVCGFTLVVSGFYALLFVPLVPPSIIALIAFGLGLLSLSPILAWFALLRTSRRVRATFGAMTNWKRDWRIGAAAAAVILVGLEAGPLVTRVGLARALSDHPERAESGVAQLRFFHNKSTLLRTCYEGNRGTSMVTDISGWMMRGWQVPFTIFDGGVWVNHDSSRSREIFYRVTGTPFNSMRPPSWVTDDRWISRGTAWDEVEFDDHLGGDQVAVRIRGLTMSQSRLDAHLDPLSNIGYSEWTTEFTNESSVAREARFQVMLPEDGVISRVTLWINGEPREAAFAGKALVKTAYKEVAVRQRRDPVLVTACGPGRVMVQCFPVPADGGTMKIRLGMTAALTDGRFSMPVILEQNFGMKLGINHAVWVQSPREFTWSEDAGRSRPDGPGHSLRLSLEPNDLSQDAWYARLKKVAPAEMAWCDDQFAEPGERRLERTWDTEQQPALDHCVVVLDGSASLLPYRTAIGNDLEKLAGHENLQILLATDRYRELAPDEVRSVLFSGGRNNVPALAEALSRAAESGKGAVVWIHGPQPMRGLESEALNQIFERSARNVTLYSVPVGAGGNRILEDVFKFRAVRMGPRHATEGDRLHDWLQPLLAGGSQPVERWSRGPRPSGPNEGRKVWDQLARWWATGEVRNARRMQTPDAEQVALAAKYQLVTAYSGAVVLETAEQYERHGLKPIDPSVAPTVPGVPEPGVITLLLPAALLTMWRRRRSKAP